MNECAVCGRTSDECQVNYCTMVKMYLCSKHKNQFRRHGRFIDPKEKLRTCEFCGVNSTKTTVHWCEQAMQYLCLKHRSQFVRLGYCMEQTKRDKNQYRMFDDHAEIILTDRDMNIIGKALIDLDDVEKCSKLKWYQTELMEHTRYVKAMCGEKRISLHRFILSYDGDMVVDHINRDGMDNRKSNLRIVSPSENSVNTRTRSLTGYKNVYKSHNRYTVRIIRNYQVVYNDNFDSIEEAVIARDRFLSEYNKAHNRCI